MVDTSEPLIHSLQPEKEFSEIPIAQPKTAKKEVPEIIVDQREAPSGIAGILRKMGAIVKESQLPVGDFILSDRVCVERKTRNDFEQSIIDGRLFQQLPRLSESFEKPIVVVEGEKFDERVGRNAVLGAISAILLDFNASIFFTRDEQRTAELLFAIAKREQVTEKKPIRLKGYKRALTISQQQRMLVETLPGVGPKLAKALLAYFGTPENVFTANNEKLQEVEKVGEEKAKRIRKILVQEYNEAEDNLNYG